MKHYKIILAFILCCILVFSYLLLENRYNDTTFILCYHKVDIYKGGLRSVQISPKNFEKQMKYLYKKGYKTISLNELVNIMSAGYMSLPPKSFVITFDDGYENNYTNALPIIEKYNFTATVFLTAGYIDKKFMYPSDTAEETHLTKNQIKQMSIKGISFGSHSLTHPDITKISKKELIKELAGSKKTIEKIIRKPVNLFCYPFGYYDENTRELVKKAGFKGSCSIKTGLIYFGRKKYDMYELPRVEFKEFEDFSLPYLSRSIDFYVKILFGF